jgi:hypothetical protein
MPGASIGIVPSTAPVILRSPVAHPTAHIHQTFEIKACDYVIYLHRYCCLLVTGHAATLLQLFWHW